MPAWLLLTVAIGAEVGGTIALKFAHGFSRPLPALLAITGFLASIALLGAVLKRLDVGLVYAIWAGAGTAVVAVLGVLIFREPMSGARMLGIVLVIGGVVMLNRSGVH